MATSGGDCRLSPCGPARRLMLGWERAAARDCRCCSVSDTIIQKKERRPITGWSPLPPVSDTLGDLNDDLGSWCSPAGRSTRFAGSEATAKGLQQDDAGRTPGGTLVPRGRHR